MGITEILTLAGGLALFLLGMNEMSSGLEAVAGSKMKGILQKLTSNRFLGVAVGMIITAVIQSSSATTVMVVGFVNCGMMSLSQAIWVIMGANIGTTITGILIGLDVGGIAPVFAIVGVVFMVFVKKRELNEIGKILAGFGILFIGMDMMSGSMAGLKDVPEFVNLMTSFSHPVLGILAGALFTAVIQSSSASVGILQGLASSGAILFKDAVFVLFGQNIGTCITAVIAALGTSRNAKRTTIIHLSFNIIGTIIFTIICLILPLPQLIEDLVPSPMMQIATMHTVFNITTTIILIPFGLYIVKFAEIILPDDGKGIMRKIFSGKKLDRSIGGTAIHLENTKLEIAEMFDLAKQNINYALAGLVNYDNYDPTVIASNEKTVNKLDESIKNGIVACLGNENDSVSSKAYSSYLHIATNIERLSDHSTNISEAVMELKNNGIVFNKEVIDEMINMQNLTKKALDVVFTEDSLSTMKDIENTFDDLTLEYKNNMIDRLKKSICKAEGSMIYSKVLIDFERIGDHLLNISEYLDEIK